MLESFYKNVFCDIVKPQIGSIVKVDLAFGLTHSGIYIGRNRIVELANLDGDAVVRVVSPEQFIEGDNLLLRTGAFIYVACAKDHNGDCYPLASSKIARRAKDCVGQRKRYNLIFNNCHMFTEYCITSKENGSGLLMGVEQTLIQKFDLQPHQLLLDMWRSTGESRGSNPSFDRE